jgi:hypothetical protein
VLVLLDGELHGDARSICSERETARSREQVDAGQRRTTGGRCPFFRNPHAGLRDPRIATPIHLIGGTYSRSDCN